MAQSAAASITRDQPLEILGDFVTRPELRAISDAQAMATANGKLIRAIMRALIDGGVVTEQQIRFAEKV